MKPNTRREAFLMKHMGFDVETPEPATREEMILANAPGGNGNKFVAYIMEDDDGNLVCDKTLEEIEAAYETKTIVLDFFGTELRQDGGVQGRNCSFAGADFAGLPIVARLHVTIMKDGAVEVSEEGYDLSSLKIE